MAYARLFRKLLEQLASSCMLMAWMKWLFFYYTIFMSTVDELIPSRHKNTLLTRNRWPLTSVISLNRRDCLLKRYKKN